MMRRRCSFTISRFCSAFECSWLPTLPVVSPFPQMLPPSKPRKGSLTEPDSSWSTTLLSVASNGSSKTLCPTKIDIASQCQVHLKKVHRACEGASAT